MSREVARWAGQNIKDVVVSKDYKFMCSSLGQQMIEDDIKEKGLTGVVVGACSPHLHEKTFRAACKRAGLNPYLCHMTNLREHVSWVNTDKAAGTVKAKSLISAAAERVKHQKPLEPMRVKVNSATLVVGGGIAGLQATLELADAGYHVYLVEREPSIGGHMAQFDKTFPTLDCSACILTPKMSEVGQHENVTMLTYSELEEVSGSVGNFKVKIRKKARYVNYDKCTGCGICVEKCPRKIIDDVFEAGMGYRKAIYTPFPQAVPRTPVIDTANCTWFTKGKCQVCLKVCPTSAVDYDQQDEIVELEVGNIIMATGWKLFDCGRDSAVRLRAAAKRVYEPGVRAALQRRRADQRQDRAPRRQDRAAIGRHHPLRRQPRREHQSLLLVGLLHGGLEVRATCCWKRPRPRCTPSTSTCARR